MASSNATDQENQNKYELNQTQLNTLVSAIGLSEADICKIFGELQAKFPSDGLTLEEFCQIYYPQDDNDSSNIDGQKNDYCKLLFDIIDQNHSGKIDLYDYILAVGLLEKEDPQVCIKKVFQLCDSNHDGLLTYSEVENVLPNFIITASGNNAELGGPGEDGSPINEIMTIMRNAFGDEAQISEQEFAELCAGNEELTHITKIIADALVFALSHATAKFTE